MTARRGQSGALPDPAPRGSRGRIAPGGAGAIRFDPDALWEALRAHLAGTAPLVALSGGADSTALLLAAVALRADGRLPGLGAVHVDHGLQPDSGRWAERARELCAGLDVALDVVRVDARARPGESPEAAARRARYAALAARLGAGATLCTAHHRDDQAETVLLALARGGGPRGLAGMAVRRRLGRGWLVRPLLDFPRASLRAWLEGRARTWLEDPWNRDPRFDRAFLRAEVMPRLEARWPGFTASAARAARRQGELVELAEALGREDLRRAAAADGTLSRRALAALGPARGRNAVRVWLREAGIGGLTECRLGRIERELVRPAAPPRPRRVGWPGGEVRRYRDRLECVPGPGPEVPLGTREWRPPAPLALGHGVLEARAVTGDGLRRDLAGAGRIEVGARRPGERCRVAGRPGTRLVRKLFQELGVPPWRRDRLPFVYVDGRLAAVADLWICEGFAAPPGVAGWRLSWRECPAPAEPGDGGAGPED